MIPAYSVSKPFLAQAVLELKLDLDAPVGQYLSDLPEVYAHRRIRDLLNHTSGLYDYSALTEYNEAVAKRERAWSRAELLQRAEALAHDRQGFSYSNIGYLLLVMLVEIVSTKPYFDALNTLVFHPIGIEGFEAWHSPHPAIADYDPSWVYSGTFLAEPGVLVAGLAKLVAHRQNSIGLQAGLVAVELPDTGFDNPGYNFGFMVDGGRNGRPIAFAGHGGGGPGFQHMALVRVDNSDAAIEVSTDGLDQGAAIEILKARLIAAPRPIARRLPKRMSQLEAAARLFETKKVYSEGQVNALLQLLFEDHVFARRLLIEWGFLTRTPDGSAYSLLRTTRN